MKNMIIASLMVTGLMMAQTPAPAAKPAAPAADAAKAPKAKKHKKHAKKDAATTPDATKPAAK